MKVGRNDPCPCGSGKKYKKCCMEKDNIIQLNKILEERFYEQKEQLVGQLLQFLERKFRTNKKEMDQLKETYEKKLAENKNIDDNIGLFNFYSFFIHRYSNGLRGVEWFYEEIGHHLEDTLKTMAKTWTELKFQLVHMIDRKQDVYIFEDVITKETYPVAKHNENVPERIEHGSGTLGLLELHNNKYYFNGVRLYVDPIRVSQGKNKIETLMKKTGLTYEQLLMEYPLEIMNAMNDDLQLIKEEVAAIIDDLQLSIRDYTESFVLFYKEKTVGKSENTIRKYRESLKDLNALLEKNEVHDLNKVDEDTWKKLITEDYFDMYDSLTKTQVKDFLSTLKAFVKWLDENDREIIWPGLLEFLKKEENNLIEKSQRKKAIS